MKSLVIGLLSICTPLICAGQNYGIGYAVVSTDQGNGRYFKTIFITSIVNLDSLLGEKQMTKRSTRRQLLVYTKSMDKFVSSQVKRYSENTGLKGIFEMYNEIDLNYTPPEPKSKRVKRAVNDDAFTSEIMFINKAKATKLRMRAIDRANKEYEARVIIL